GRHTRCLSDWSSDVCSSDLTVFLFSGLENDAKNEILQPVLQYGHSAAGGGDGWSIGNWWVTPAGIVGQNGVQEVNPGDTVTGVRSEERRVGKSGEHGGQRAV